MTMRLLLRWSSSSIRVINNSQQQQGRSIPKALFLAYNHRASSSSSSNIAETTTTSQQSASSPPSSSSSARRRKRPSFQHNPTSTAAIRGSEVTHDSSNIRNSDDAAATTTNGPPFTSHVDSLSSSVSFSNNAAFAPLDPLTGKPLDAQAYLTMASLSPWVPCPDIVVKRVLEIANVTTNDVHVDLGCGDGRLNFAALDYYTGGSTNEGENKGVVGGVGGGVKESWGIDIDTNILERCNARLRRRYVPPTQKKENDNNNNNNSSGRLEFVQADLVQVVEREKWKYQQQFNDGTNEDNNNSISDNNNSNYLSSSNNNQDGNKDLITKYDSISARIANTTTIVTVYFVDDSLRILRPYLAYLLGGKSNVRVLTIGYEMKGGWEPSWVENVLGLTIFKYDMEFISNVPLEWIIDKTKEHDDDDGSDQAAGVINDKKVANAATTTTARDSRKLVDHAAMNITTSNIDLDLDYETPEIIEYLKQKRLADMEVLNDGLRIHHDERLDEFAGARRNGGGGGGGANSCLDQQFIQQEEEEEWDFDETEDPDVVLKEAYREMAEMKMMMTGGGAVKKGEKEKTKPVVWKKP
jgi:hypothetical protein